MIHGNNASINTSICVIFGNCLTLYQIIRATQIPRKDAFCLESVNIIDFVPYFNKPKNPGSDIDGIMFVQCNANQQISDIQVINVYMVGIAAPIVNIIIAFQYIRKMYRLFGAMRTDYEQQTKHQVCVSMYS